MRKKDIFLNFYQEKQEEKLNMSITYFFQFKECLEML